MDQIAQAHIQTYTNKRFHILDPRPEEICIEDIAHALAMQCRFTGHTRYHYSVAQHAFYCSLIVPSEYAFEALNHDDSEAYVGDMSRPLKHFTAAGEEYLKVEARIERAIKKRFSLPAEMSPEVKKADNLMLYAEKEALMLPMDWEVKWADTEEKANVKVERWSPERAEYEFLTRFNDLYRSRVVFLEQ